MKSIIPVAGVGTRLRPHTHTTPKALLNVAGKPIIGHILDKVEGIGVEEVILIIGYMGDKVVKYVNENYFFEKISYVEQKERKGLGHAISLARDLVGGEPTFIIYGDTIFEGELPNGTSDGVDGKIGVKRVDDPRRFGVVVLSGNRIKRLVEKPKEFVSDLAIVGVNYIRNSELMFKCLQEIIERGITTQGEYQLTDAFQLMLEKGAQLEVFEVDSWFDCGKPETLLITNRHLLSNGHAKVEIPGSVVIHPVFVSRSAEVIGSIIGPYVSIADGARVRGSIIRNSIVGQNSVVDCCLLEGSLIGDNAMMRGSLKRVNVGDSSEIDFD